MPRPAITWTRTLFTLTVTATLLAVLVLAAQPPLEAKAISVDELLELGKPVAIHLGTGPPAAVFVDEARARLILVVPAPGAGVYTVSVIKYGNLEKMYMIYPVNGEPTSIHVDRPEAPRLLVIGTSSGEVLAVDTVLNYTVYIQGGEYPIVKARAMVGGKIAVLDMEGTLRIYSISRGGWYELSRIIDTSIREGREGVLVHDFEPLLHATGNNRYYEPLLAVLEEPIEGQASIILTVLKRLVVDNETVLAPLNNTQVILYIEDLKQYVTGYTGKTGVAQIGIPIPATNITVYVQYEGFCYKTRLTNLNITEEGVEYQHPQPLIVDEMEEVLCPRPYRSALVTIYDARGDSVAPLARIPVRVFSSASFLHLFMTVEERGDYIIVLEGVFNDTESQYGVLLLRLDSSYRVVSKQWLRLPEPGQTQPPIITSVSVSPDGNIIALGTKTGRLYLLHYNGERYVHEWTYVVDDGARIAVSTGLTVGTSKGIYPIAAVSERGSFQVLVANTSLNVPVLRIGHVLDYNTGLGRWVAVSRDMSVAAVTTREGILLVLGLWAAPLRTPQIDPINLTDYIVTPLVVAVHEPDGTPVAAAKVSVYTLNGSLVKTVLTNSSGVAVFDYLLPGTYLLRVEPQQYWLDETTTIVRVEPGGSTVEVTLHYRPVPVTITLLDSYTGGAPEDPLRLVVEGPVKLEVPVEPGTREVTVHLIKGVYNVTIEPASAQPLYEPVSRQLRIPGDENITIELKRIVRVLLLNVLDERGNTITEPVRIQITDSLGRTLYTATVTREQLPVEIRLNTKGLVTLRISSVPRADEEPKYKEITYRVNLTGATTLVSLRLPFNYIPVTLIFIDKYTGSPPIVPLKVMEAGRVLAIVAPGTSEKTFYFTKGVHRLTIVAQGQGDLPPLYRNVTLTLDVRATMAESIVLERAYAEVTLSFIDALTRTLPIDQLEIYANETNIAEVGPGTKEITVYIAKGNVELVVRSKNKVYYDYKEDLVLTNDTLSLMVGLRRVVSTIRVLVVDDLGQRITGAQVLVSGVDVPFETTTTTVDGEAFVQLPYGSYQICVEAQWFYPACEMLSTAAQSDITIMLRPQPVGILLRNLPLIIVVAVMATVVAVIYMKRSAILKALALEEEEVI